ncbi:22237_t:CDS:2 [Cetraspora pellucida]|uniref:22237_t:CDS:1 n=1 Tax=Cetraspora pellucida TaxID=1433469 RepID=A0A9N8YW53_9GLOM|nr:22237_t:CDS:2 [Cetraspora pellucida]
MYFRQNTRIKLVSSRSYEVIKKKSANMDHAIGPLRFVIKIMTCTCIIPSIQEEQHNKELESCECNKQSENNGYNEESENY